MEITFFIFISPFFLKNIFFFLTKIPRFRVLSKYVNDFTEVKSMHGMVKTTWAHLWKWHHQAVYMLHFSVGMDDRKWKKDGGDWETSRLDGSPPSYTQRNNIGLVLGPKRSIWPLILL